MSHIPRKAVNSLAPGKFEWTFRYVIFQGILVIDGQGISWEIALIWMSVDFTDDQSTLVQVMAWCCQATSHYLSQCWPRSMSLNGITRPQWVTFNHSPTQSLLLEDYPNYLHFPWLVQPIRLTYWDLHKMADILKGIFYQNLLDFDSNFPELDPKGPIDLKPPFVPSNSPNW